MGFKHFIGKDFGPAPEERAPIVSRKEEENIDEVPPKVVSDELVEVPSTTNSAERMVALENTFAKAGVTQARYAGLPSPFTIGEKQRGKSYDEMGYTPSKFALSPEYAKAFEDKNGFKVKKQVEKSQGDLKPPIKKKEKKVAEKGGFKVKKEKSEGTLKPPMKKENMMGHGGAGNSWSERFLNKQY